VKRKLTFPSDACRLAEVRREARVFLAECGFEECAAELLILALDEACTNIIRYAYGGPTQNVIRLNIDSLKHGVRCILRDYGKSCDPSKIRSRDLADFRPGGLGVRIIQTAFDHVVFEPKPRGTQLTLTKKLLVESRSAAKTAAGNL